MQALNNCGLLPSSSRLPLHFQHWDNQVVPGQHPTADVGWQLDVEDPATKTVATRLSPPMAYQTYRPRHTVAPVGGSCRGHYDGISVAAWLRGCAFPSLPFPR